jgi:mono/diheme cytochrome c family protein
MRSRNVVWCGAALASVLVLAACGRSGEQTGEAKAATPTVKISPEVRQEAQQTFLNRCSVCHGQEGRGDGPGSAGLTPAPRNYHDQAWQASVTDEQIEKTIIYGGAAVGKSPAMVANPDLGNRPELVAALREIVRGFGKQ